MSTTAFAFFLLALAPLVSAECPNGCSGHGTCSLHDQCTCCRNWQGADCSQRTCPFGYAFVDSPKGDLDGSTGALTTSAVITGSNVYPYGTPELYPAATEDEGHFYMECSNKGLCNREEGICECFPGYEGSACHRTSCPNGCSGHGTCETIKELAEDREDGDLSSGVYLAGGYPAGDAGIGDLSGIGGQTYELWDKTSTMGCKCDPGFTGPDCSLKLCRYGVDPLYVPSNYLYAASGVDQVETDAPAFEKSFVEILADDESTMRGTFDLTLYDVYGEKFILDGLSYAPYESGEYTTCEEILAYFPNERLQDTTAGSYHHQMRHRGGLVSSAYVDGTTRAFCTVEAVNVTSGFVDYEDALHTTILSNNRTGIRYEFDYGRGNPGYHKDVRISNLSPATATINATVYGYYGVDRQGEVAEYTDDTADFDVTLPGYIYSAENGSTTVQMSSDVHFYIEAEDCSDSDECKEYKSQHLQIFGRNYRINATGEEWLEVGSASLADQLIGDDRPGYSVDSKIYRPITNITLNEPVIFTGVAYNSISAGSPAKVPVAARLTQTYQYVSECSNRGSCDRETGLCQCYTGYSHDNCDTQTPVC
mmetsp:Transcript_14692/g.43522  ORF Transcript_14692/g.43522 Transcript_14692/m.43522 type:complete len:593 (-) Transcript_14692:288-2066(-)|eukprot:CAMPEP_0118973442 /NCGR_PEP_ID=MMETSP1173-20130426/10124_1 /TAXON_ID=1034831 /ORGANISM="Rhizochromulina marina cf, Strain CCMP1243" /LENGTH=592 /DNA_ID=CAMNT_0006923099 /DNA_START=69 /DNA_END=1847 /DNA_ORIENTATION=-